VRVALQEVDGRAIPGFGFDDATPITTDDVAAKLQWRNAAAPPLDRPIRIALKLRNARLYSLAGFVPEGGESLPSFSRSGESSNIP
jgi:hypothetical protein